jgi:hypothetical protein
VASECLIAAARSLDGSRRRSKRNIENLFGASNPLATGATGSNCGHILETTRGGSALSEDFAAITSFAFELEWRFLQDHRRDIVPLGAGARSTVPSHSAVLFVCLEFGFALPRISP